MDIWCCLLCIPFSVGVLYLSLSVRWIARKLNSEKIPYVYTQPGFYYPLKYYIFRIILWLRKRQNEQRQKSKEASSDGAGYGVRSRNSPEEMDKVQEIPEGCPLAVDAVYFNGGNADGVYFVAATARRPANIVNTLLYLRAPNIGLLEMPSLPDTWLSDEKSQSAYTAGGLLITPVRPMEAWSIAFDGEMRIAETGQKVHVSFNLLWKATTKPFDFDTDLHPHIMAAAIAREQWSREYFDTLKMAHQTHYEQFGEITGTAKVAGYPDVEIKVRGVRDHSYGNVRDWKDIHRYTLNYAQLEDGTAVCAGTICMPSTLSRLDVGYVFHPDGRMDPVKETNFEFYKCGDNGVSPDHFEMDFIAGDKSYHMVCDVIQRPIFYMGKDWDAKIHERFSKYTINGVKGWGISEWDYRNLNGKDSEMMRLENKKREN